MGLFPSRRAASSNKVVYPTVGVEPSAARSAPVAPSSQPAGTGTPGSSLPAAHLPNNRRNVLQRSGLCGLRSATRRPPARSGTATAATSHKLLKDFEDEIKASEDNPFREPAVGGAASIRPGSVGLPDALVAAVAAQLDAAPYPAAKPGDAVTSHLAYVGNLIKNTMPLGEVTTALHYFSRIQDRLELFGFILKLNLAAPHPSITHPLSDRDVFLRKLFVTFLLFATKYNSDFTVKHAGLVAHEKKSANRAGQESALERDGDPKQILLKLERDFLDKMFFDHDLGAKPADLNKQIANLKNAIV